MGVIPKNVNLHSLIHKDVLRKYISPEWLSKISSTEFQAFTLFFKSIYNYNSMSETEFQEIFNNEIITLETEYQRIKKKYAELDKSINDTHKKLHDIISAPAIPNAVLEARKRGIVFEDSSTAHITRRDKYVPSNKSNGLIDNGRNYPVDFLIKKDYDDIKLGGEIKDIGYLAQPSDVGLKLRTEQITGNTFYEIR